MIFLRQLTIWLASITAEGGALGLAFYVDPPMLWEAALCHVLAVCPFLMLWNSRPSLGVLGGFQALLVLSVPGVGLILAITLYLMLRFTRHSSVTSEYEQMVQRKSVSTDMGASASMTNENIREQIDVIPMVETLDGDDFVRKRQAVERLARRRNPKSVALLKKALEDEHPDIRFYASGALTQIESKVAVLVKEAEREVAKHPDDAAARRNLGNAYYDYIYMGLLDPILEEDYRRRAVHSYNLALEMDPDQPDVLVRLARAHLDSRQWDEAKDALSKAIVIADEEVQPYLWRAETQFASGDIESAINDCRKAIEIGNVPEAVKETLTWLTNS